MDENNQSRKRPREGEEERVGEWNGRGWGGKKTHTEKDTQYICCILDVSAMMVVVLACPTHTHTSCTQKMSKEKKEKGNKSATTKRKKTIDKQKTYKPAFIYFSFLFCFVPAIKAKNTA